MALTLLIILAIGFLLSLYSFYVERKVSSQKNYKAVCDISDKLSCTKAFATGYGKIFGISNGLAGMLFYGIVLITVFYGALNLAFYLSVLSIFASLYLAYVLQFKVRAVCLICYSIYAVNILLLIFSYSKLQ
ncbi:vitamin K epoxide reductase family protein [Candidatus Woesearchaeota archaeon]|nr:vitamin K epoxide reductase family protein [Candidatus Woesearchaeota archaeon]